MRLTVFLFLLLNIPTTLSAQTVTLADHGYTSIPFTFKGEKVEIILLSAGTEFKKFKKPLFLFVQGSLPRPLFFHDKKGNYYGAPLPFQPRPAFDDYHFVVVGKPGVPLITTLEALKQPQYTYVDPQTNAFPRDYCKNNHLDYYVERNKAILKFLAKKDWVDKNKIVVAGHSEGVQVALKMAIDKAKLTHLVLLNAGLEGRIMSILTNQRSNEKTEKEYEQTESFFDYWQTLIHTKGEYSDDCSIRDSDKATASFSFPYRKYLHKVKVPVFFGYGTKDASVLLMDNLRVQTIRRKLDNYHFKSYFGLEHSFMKVKDNGEIDYEDYRFDQVAADFFDWLKIN